MIFTNGNSEQTEEYKKLVDVMLTTNPTAKTQRDEEEKAVAAEERRRRLEKAVRSISLHDHATIIYEKDDQQLETSLPYIKFGLERGEKCVYIADEGGIQKVLEDMHGCGIDTDNLIQKGALSILTPKDTYFAHQEFVPDDMIVFLKEKLAQAKKDGYSALRVFGEMNWALCGDSVCERLREYEEKLNMLLRENDCTSMSQYDRRKFTPPVIVDVIRTHPIIVVGDVLCKNSFYIPVELIGIQKTTSNDVDSLLNALLEREHLDRDLLESKEKFSATFYGSPDLIFIIRPLDGMILDMNDDYSGVLGYIRSDCIGKTTNELDFWVNSNDYYSFIANVDKVGKVKDFEMKLRRKDKTIVTVTASAHTVEIDGAASIIAIIHDITELKKREESLVVGSVMLRMLSEVNGILVHATNEIQLLQNTCDIVIETGGFSLAWVGYAENDLNKTIRPIVRAGDDAGYVDKLKLTWSNGERGYGAASMAIRTGSVVNIRDVSADPNIGLWRSDALARGYHSILAVPLVIQSNVIGAISVYSDKVDGFSVSDAALFQELASDISFGIQALRVDDEEKVVAKRLSEAYAKEKALLEGLSEAVVALDNNGQIIMVNKAMEKLLRMNENEIVGYSVEKILLFKDQHGTSIVYDERPSIRAIKNKLQIGPIEFNLVLHDGAEIPIDIISSPVVLDGNVVGAINVIHELTKSKEIEKLRTDFLSLASHQLRTPLSGTKWIIETLREKKIGPLLPAQDKYLDEIYTINERMIHLVNDMLSAIRVDSEDFAFEKAQVSVPEMMDKIMTLLGSAAKSKNLKIIDRSKEHSIPRIESGQVPVTTILETFISNAIDYSKEGQEITFDVVEEKDSVAFVVHDVGIGIPLEEQTRTFERFFRASNARRARPSGTGLGLNIANMLAKRLGAEITFTSNEKDGTTFVLHIHNT